MLPKINRVAFILSYLLVQAHGNSADVSWPSGAFGLPKPITTCPNCETDEWSEGWIFQDLEDDPINSNSISRKSKESHMEFAVFEFGNNILRFFCMKQSTTTYSRPWPKGKYCVYKSKNALCPENMTPGWVLWDDEDNDHQTKVGNHSPDGSYVNDTKIFYCCQNEGNVYDSIELPVEEPFYLLTSSSTLTPKCQMVMWAFSYLEYLVFDTEKVNNSDSHGGDHVFIANKTVYYCYYKDCRSRKTAPAGLLSSHPPPVTDTDPHSQYCSWLITVAEQLVISLKFKKLSVPNCNDAFLRIYDGANESAPLNGTYCGSNATTGFEVLSHTNSLYVVSNTGNNVRNSKNIPRLVFQATYISKNRTEKSPKPKSSPTFTTYEVLAFVLGGCLFLSILLNIIVLCLKHNNRKKTPEPSTPNSPNPVNFPMEEVEYSDLQSPLYQEPRYPDFEVFSEIEEEEYVIPATAEAETGEVHVEPKTPSTNPDLDEYQNMENIESNSLPATIGETSNAVQKHLQV